MKKDEFVSLVAQKSGCTKKQTDKVLTAVLESIGDLMADGDKINFVDFGCFETKIRIGREVRIPASDKVVHVPDTRIPVFRAGKGLKKKVENNEIR